MNTLKFFTDGGCRKNPGPAASGIYLPDLSCGLGRYIGDSRTNNEAEAEAFLLGLEYAKAHSFENLDIYSDSQLLVHLVNGWWTPSASTMKAMLAKIFAVIYDFYTFEVTWVPRAQNAEADWVCNQVLDAAEKGELLTCPTLFSMIPSSLCSSTAT